MKLLKYMKDGGQESRVWGFWLVEIKKLFSVALLHFKDGSRDAHHSHAFHSISWVLKGKLVESRIDEGKFDKQTVFEPSFKPILTTRSNTHKVVSIGDTWVFTLRGPWSDTWKEFLPGRGFITLTHGRKEIAQPSQ